MLRAADDTQPRSEAAIGLLYGVATYALWGVAPLYFKPVAHVPALFVLAHRILWSIVFLLIVVAIQRRWFEIVMTLRNRRIVMMLVLSSIAIAINWFIYIWAISNNQVISASLGYFINPLVAVLLGVVVLRERMRVGQTIAIVLAAAAVIGLVVAERRVPTIALAIAVSFASYGLLRKIIVVAPMIGLLIETIVLMPFSLTVIGYQSTIAPPDVKTLGFLILLGVLTAVPLIWFSAAARRLRLSTMGFLQYLSPTGQFLLGRFLYHEEFSRARLISFTAIWAALLIFTVDSAMAYRRSRQRLLELSARQPGTRSSVG